MYAVLAFYYRNKDRIDQYLRQTEAEIRRQEEEFRQSYAGPSKEVLQRRLRQKRARQAEEAALAR